MSRTVMFIFPGQGSQYRGMGSDIHAEFEVARDAYAEASDVLGYDMTELSFADPDEQIGLTRYTQPALLTHSIACMRVFNELTGDSVIPHIAAGHSLGEYSALVAAGSLTLEEGLKLVQKRGELMGEHGEGGMMALTLDLETAQPLADRFYCQVGGCNLPEQTVVGGREEDLAALAECIKELYPRKRAVPLATEGAFHTYFMVKAAQLFREVLDATDFHDPSFSVLANYTGRMHESNPESIRARLFFQLFSPVRWVTCIGSAVAAGVDTFVEFGGGLGKVDDPAEKRPNLESIIKKSLRSHDHEAEYCAAINCGSIRESAELLGN